MRQCFGHRRTLPSLWTQNVFGEIPIWTQNVSGEISLWTLNVSGEISIGDIKSAVYQPGDGASREVRKKLPRGEEAATKAGQMFI